MTASTNKKCLPAIIITILDNKISFRKKKIEEKVHTQLIPFPTHPDGVALNKCYSKLKTLRRFSKNCGTPK
jgi:hypothetical protein